jgi:hypothetical protein
MLFPNFAVKMVHKISVFSTRSRIRIREKPKGENIKKHLKSPRENVPGLIYQKSHPQKVPITLGTRHPNPRAPMKMAESSKYTGFGQGLSTDVAMRI